MKVSLPGVKPEHVWPAEHVLVLPGAIVLLRKKDKKRWSVAAFGRSGSSDHTGSNSLAGAVREGQRSAKRFRDSSIDQRLLRSALRNLLNIV